VTRGQAIDLLQGYLDVLREPCQPLEEWTETDAGEVGWELVDAAGGMLGAVPTDAEYGLAFRLAAPVVQVAMILARIPK
jgi:hypothetical protein